MTPCSEHKVISETISIPILDSVSIIGVFVIGGGPGKYRRESFLWLKNLSMSVLLLGDQ